MLEAFLTFINQEKLDLSKKSTLLAVSGGVDSVVLAHLFHSAGFKSGIAHCNFGLRGHESEGDAKFVEQLASDYGFPFYVKDFSTKEFAKSQGISTQMAARDLRYSWFEEIKDKCQFDWVATAHHANDSFETVILNLVRGTGLAGLHGIDAKNDYLIRPLLFATREDISDYIRANRLVWREDSSNESRSYKRNLIRHEVMPVFKKMNPSLETTFETTSHRIKSAEKLLENFLRKWKEEISKIADGAIHIPVSALSAADEPIYRLWFILQDFGFSYAQVREIYKSKGGISGKIFYSATHKILRDRAAFIISENEETRMDETLEITDVGSEYSVGKVVLKLTSLKKSEYFLISSKLDNAFFDLDNLSFPLKIRSWAFGDTFCPFGMGGRKKKVSDLLVDQKLNLNQKKNVKVLLNGNGDILWVIGLRTDDRYRITDETLNILHITSAER